MLLTWRRQEAVHRGLADVAAESGTSERRMAKELMSRVQSGDMMNLLSVGAQADLSEWATNNGLVESTGQRFMMAIRLSEGRKHDAMLFCACTVDLSGDDAIIRCLISIPGVSGAAPAIMRGMKSFEVAMRSLDLKMEADK
jgi:hypothetical protein